VLSLSTAIGHIPPVHISSEAIICSVRQHGEVGAIVRAFTAQHGLIGGYVQGARGRVLRPVLIPGNVIKGDWRSRIAGQLPTLIAEPQHSRAHLLGEPLAIAAIDWVTALTATTLPEEHPYPNLHYALDGVLSAVELAPAARVWAGAVAQYEALLIRELGYAEELQTGINAAAAPAAVMSFMARNRKRLIEHLLGDRHTDVMAARERLIDRLKRAVA
jgi:DNA repair protein RecO (recombination protein O)